MTWEEFTKKRFISFEKIIVQYPNHIPIECMLIGVDFLGGLFHVKPFDKEVYEDKDYWVSHEYCNRPKFIVIKGKKKKD